MGLEVLYAHAWAELGLGNLSAGHDASVHEASALSPTTLTLVNLAIVTRFSARSHRQALSTRGGLKPVPTRRPSPNF